MYKNLISYKIHGDTRRWTDIRDIIRMSQGDKPGDSHIVDIYYGVNKMETLGSIGQGHLILSKICGAIYQTVDEYVDETGELPTAG